MEETKKFVNEEKNEFEDKTLEVIPSKEEKVLFEWEALERPFQKKDFEFWTTVIAILALVCLILFFIKEWFFIATLIAFVFFYYVLTTVKPGKVKHKITNKGIFYADNLNRFDWESLRSFWFAQKWGFRLLNIETWLNYPRVLHLMINDKDAPDLEKILLKYLPKEEEETKKNFLDKFSAWLLKNLPLESKKEVK